MTVNKSMHKRTYRFFPTYPNEADHNYYAQKALDITTGIVSGIGLVVSFVFLAAIM